MSPLLTSKGKIVGILKKIKSRYHGYDLQS